MTSSLRDCSGRLVCGVLFCRGLNHSCVTEPRLSALQGRCRPDHSCLVASHKAVSLDLYFSWFTVPTSLHSYADDSQLYFHVDPAAVDNKVQQLVDCVDEISHWMSVNRLKLNKDKTQFIWLKPNSITLSGSNQLRTSSEPPSVIEFGRESASSCYFAASKLDDRPNFSSEPTPNQLA